MKLGAKNAKTGWKVVSLAVVCALMLGPLTACGYDVNTTLVSGMKDLVSGAAEMMIDAAFVAITPDQETGGSGIGGDTVQ